MFYGITTADLGVSGALMVALCGFVTVFILLGCLAVLIVISSKVIGAIESQRKPAPAPAPKAAPAPVAAPAAPAEDEEELVAVAMAAIAEETGCPLDSFRITGIQAR